MTVTHVKIEKTNKDYKTNVYSVQRAKRGDIWFILALIFPISIILASLTFEETIGGSSTAEYFIVNFLFFSLDINNLAISFPFSLQLDLPFIVPSNGHPIYSSFAFIQFFCVLLAIIVRLYQYIKENRGELIESGVVGVLACLIAFFEIIKFLISESQLIDLHLIKINRVWSAGLIDQFTLNNSLLKEIPIIPESLLGFGLPFSFIFKLLPLIPFGFVFVVLWAYQEYKAFPPAFIKWVTRVVRYSIIGIFVVISVFPLIWIFFVTLNNNITLRAGRPIWPLNINAPIDSKAWKAFFNIRTYPSHTEIEGFTFLALTLFFIFLAIVLYKVRKRISLTYENILKDRFRSSTKLLSSFAFSIFLVVFSVSTIFFLSDVIDQIFDPWNLIFGVVSLFILLSMIFKYKNWYLAFEGFFLEDGVGISFSAISGILALLFFYLTNTSIKWVYYQWETAKEFNVGNWFFITVLLGAGVSLIVIVIASISAYSLSRFRFHGRGVFGGMILSTQIFPGVILVLPLFIMMARLGLTGEVFGLGFAYSAIALPFVTYLLKGFFDAIPPDLEEQAMIDGTTRIGAFRKVVLPLALPGIISTFIFSFLAIYTEYLMALVIYNPTNQDNYTIALAMLKVFQADITQRGVYYNEMAVFAIIVALPIIASFIYLQKYLLTGLTAGGTKG